MRKRSLIDIDEKVSVSSESLVVSGCMDSVPCQK